MSSRARPSAEDQHLDAAIRSGIWAPFRSLLLAQALSAGLGLVFWVLVAHLVAPSQVGIAAAAISLQTTLGIVTVLGIGTMFIAELPRFDPTRQRTMVLRALLVVGVVSLAAGGLVVAVHPLLPDNLRLALENPIGAVTFIAGVAAAGWSLLIDDCALAVRRSQVQVARNLFASSLRFPLSALLLGLGATGSHVLQVCWVAPLLLSIGAAFWRLRLPRGDADRPRLRADVRDYGPAALRNHLLSLSLSTASQMVPVIAGLALTAVGNAEFAIAWQMATFVFLPPYLLATALFVHGANVTTEEFRTSMERTVPAALLLSFVLCVGAWTLGRPVLLIFGGAYADRSWPILALLVPAGLWIVFKDHMVALWRSQRRFALATRLGLAALVLEMAGVTVGARLGGAIGLCLGWLTAMAVEIVLATPLLRQAFGGLHWRSPLRLTQRPQTGRVSGQLVGVVVFLLIVGGIGVWTATRGSGGDGSADPGTGGSGTASTAPSCEPTRANPGPLIDLSVQAATGRPEAPLLSDRAVQGLVTAARAAGAQVISTSASFRTMQSAPGAALNYAVIDRTIAAARASGARVKLQLVGVPSWALDDYSGDPRQAPRSEAELDRWDDYVRAVMTHVAGKVAYLEVWNEPNGNRWWPTGPNPVEFTRLLARTDAVVHEVAPSTKVVSGGLIGNDIGFLSRMYAGMKTLGLRSSPFDLLGIHPFTGDTPPDVADPGQRYDREPFGTYDENFTGYKGLRQVMVDQGDERKQIYVSEFGYSTQATSAYPAVSDATRATYLTQALKEATCSQYIPVFSWYALHPSKFDPAPWTMLDDAGQPNQTYEAMVAWSRLIDQATSAPAPVSPTPTAVPSDQPSDQPSDPPSGPVATTTVTVTAR